MLNRFSSLKHLSHLQTSFPHSHMSSLSIRPVPKTYLKPIFDELSPKRVTIPEKKNIIFSSSSFKKYQDKTKELLHEFVHLVVHGSKSAYKDARNLYSIISSKSKSEYTVEEIREVKRITVDLIKFVPFYASIIIPAGELALIPYLFLFPRAVPSYFMGEKAIKENKDKYIENQFKAHQHLKEHLLEVMAQAGYDTSLQDPENMKKFFVENKDKLLPFLETQQMDSELLKNASNFLMFDYIEGNYIVNLMYKTTVNLPRYGVNLAMWIARNSYRAAWNHPIFDYSFKMNSFIFQGAKRRLLRYQFEKQLETVKNQNQAMLANLFGNLREETVMDIAKERGFYSDCPGKARKWLEEEWKQVSEAHIGDDNMCLFWHSVIKYQSL